MARSLTFWLLVGLLLFPLNSYAGSAFGEGEIDQDLKYEGFEVSSDGFLSGYIVNTSNTARQGIKLDMWTTNPQETRVFWRKSITIGELGPKGKHLIKEPYKLDEENPSKIKTMFRLTNPANFRN